MAKFLIINGGWEQIPLIKKIYKQDHRIYLINDKKPEKDLLSIILIIQKILNIIKKLY